jgi:hypothetical protein
MCILGLPLLVASIWALRLGLMKDGEDKRHVVMALLAIITDELSKQFYSHRELSECAQQVRYENLMRHKYLTTNPMILS